MDITPHYVETTRHRTHYLACGPESGPLLIFVHGWPELSHSWRHQLPVFGALGFRAVAPDMRGYGRSSAYTEFAAYAQSEVVADMLELLAALGRERAVWIGHDWGSPTVWLLASLHPARCAGVANLCVPFWTLERGFDTLLPHIDRGIYPQDEFPVGQWDYQLFYRESFARATQVFGADPYRTVKLLFRKGNPADAGQPALTSAVRKNGGWFGPLDAAPDLPRDADVVTEEDLQVYAEALGRNGFFGPDAYYMNDAANVAFSAPAARYLALPVLFLGARYDYVCETATSTLAHAMRLRCSNLTEHVFDSGHWLAQERPREVNAALARWLATKVTDYWPLTG